MVEKGNQNHATLLYSQQNSQELYCCPDQFSVQCVATVISSPPAGLVPVLPGPEQARSGALWLVCPGPPAYLVGSEKIIAMLHLNKEEQNLVLLNPSLPLSWHVFLSLCQKRQPVNLISIFMNLIFA